MGNIINKKANITNTSNIANTADTTNTTNTTDTVDKADTTNTTNTTDTVDKADTTNTTDKVNKADTTNTTDKVDKADTTNTTDKVDKADTTNTTDKVDKADTTTISDKATAISIVVMDRNAWTANTDIIVIIIPNKKTLLWVPRDLYCELINNRINKAYCKGRAELFLKSINSYDFDFNVTNCVCLFPSAIEKYIDKIKSIEVPVNIKREFKYPLHRHKPIEEGFKIITFNEPSETLTGDRFHEWIGARYAVNPKGFIGTDFDRIYRQQILVKEILKKNIDIIDNNDIDYINNSQDIRGLDINVINILKTVDSTWSFNTIDKLVSKRINNKLVLVTKKSNKIHK